MALVPAALHLFLFHSDVFGLFMLAMVVEAHPLNLVALLQGISKLVHVFVG